MTPVSDTKSEQDQDILERHRRRDPDNLAEGVRPEHQARIVPVSCSVAPLKSYTEEEHASRGIADGIGGPRARQSHRPDAECPEHQDVVQGNIQHVDDNRGVHEYAGFADAVEETAVGDHEQEEYEADETPLHVAGPGNRHGVVAREEVDHLVREEVPRGSHREAKHEREQERIVEHAPCARGIIFARTARHEHVRAGRQARKHARDGPCRQHPEAHGGQDHGRVGEPPDHRGLHDGDDHLGGQAGDRGRRHLQDGARERFVRQQTHAVPSLCAPR
jgi:hypothetical protein